MKRTILSDGRGLKGYHDDTKDPPYILILWNIQKLHKTHKHEKIFQVRLKNVLNADKSR